MALDVTALSALFPLTAPIPNPLTHPHLVPLSELALELDLVRSGSFTRWVHHLANLTAGVVQAELGERGVASSLEESLLGRKLATAAGRRGLQRLTDIYERALVQFPGSYKLWKQYLDVRCTYVLGIPKKKVDLKAPKKKRADSGEDGQDIAGTMTMLRYLKEGIKDSETGVRGEELAESERDVDMDWDNALDGIVGAEEWRALAGTFERALIWLPKVRCII